MGDGVLICAGASMVLFWVVGIVIMSMMVHTYRTDWAYKPVEDNVVG